MSLSFVFPNQSNSFSLARSVLAKIFSSKSVEKVARDSGAVVRDRKLKVNKFVFAVLTILGASPKTQNLTMKSVHNVYNRLANLGERLSAKCMHKHLDSDKMTECMKALLESISSAIAGLTQKKRAQIVPKAVRKLLKNLNVKDIVLIDGTEIDARPSLAKDEEFQGSGKGRPHLDGEPSRPGIKLHVAYSVAGQNFVYIDVTDARESERAHVLTDRLSDCLIIADRGYVSFELEKKIAESGNYFIIKGKSNSTGKIKAAFGSDSEELSDLIGSNLKDAGIKDRTDFDILSERRVPAGNGDDEQNKSSAEMHECRVVRELHECRDGEEKLITLRTNLPRDSVSAEQIFMLYRIRWTVEIFNKVCKSGNALHSINSGKKPIVFEFIILSIMSMLIKTYLGYLAQISHNFEWLSMQKLNSYLSGSVLDKFYMAIMNCGKSKIYQVVKELFELIGQNCQRGKPSARDRELLKDFPALVDAINSFWGVQDEEDD